MVRKTFLLAITSAALALGTPAAQSEQSRPGVVVQVSDDNPKTWNQALNVVRNIQAAYGKDNVQVEVVVFGLGSGMLKFDSTTANRVDDTLSGGAQVYMCENTMKGQKLTKADMHPKIGYVPAGVIEIVEKSRQGWTIVRP